MQLLHNDPDETIEPQAEDNDQPFEAPDDNGQTPSTNPQGQHTDDGVDEQELYDAGLQEAAEMQDEPKESNVEGYDPDKDQRNL